MRTNATFGNKPDFYPELLKQYDKPSREIVIRYFKKLGYTFISNPNKYEPDLVMLDGYGNTTNCYIELFVYRGWSGDGKHYNFDVMNLTQQKAKQILSGKIVNTVCLSLDMTKICLAPHQDVLQCIKSTPLVHTQNSLVSEGEYFYKLDRKYLEVHNLDSGEIISYRLDGKSVVDMFFRPVENPFDSLYVMEIDNSLGKKIICKNHYSHTISFGVTLSLGIFKKGPNNPFFEMTDDTLMGVIVYSVPTGANVHNSISPLITSQKQVFELTRLWISDELGKNSESWFISQSFKYLKKYYPDIKVLISFSDTERNHLGTIYQATNWLYQGKRDCSGGEQFSWDSGKTWHHFKGLANKYGITNRPDLMKRLPENTIIKEGTIKHRYLMLISDKKTNKQILKSLKYPILKYPK